MRPTVLLLALAAAGCDTGASSGDLDQIAPVDAEAGVEVRSADDLAARRAAWVAAGIDDYRLRHSTSGFRYQTVVSARVEDGAVVESRSADVTAPAFTVLDLYDLAAEAYAGADTVMVRTTAGPSPLPVLISVDYERGVADEEVFYQVLAFEAD